MSKSSTKLRREKPVDVPCGPISPEEQERIRYVRKSLDYGPDGSEERERWGTLYDRFYALFPTTLERLAWHEAGHATVAHRLGGTVWSIDVDAADDGFVTHVVEFEPPFVTLDRWAIATTAGYVAEGLAFGPTDPHEASEIYIKYCETVIEMGLKPSRSKAIEFIETAESVAVAILQQHWYEVSYIARRMMFSCPVGRDFLLSALAGVPFGVDGDAGVGKP
jgi:hypothetical protein